MKSKIFVSILLAFAISTAAFAKGHHKHDKNNDNGSGGLDNTIVLIIRHAEKPDSGPGLAPAGIERANRYPDYFRNYTVDSVPMVPSALFAAAISKDSQRPVLTVTPLSHALGLPIDSQFKDTDSTGLAAELNSKPHGKCVLICWHHGEIPALITALGGDPGKVIPGSKWPGTVFNWVIQMRYDKDGNLQDIQRIEEPF
jgi:broad specificity phosphatase PhoE